MISKPNEHSRLVTAPTSVLVKRDGRQLKAQGWTKRGPTAWSVEGECFYQWWDRALQEGREEPKQPEGRRCESVFSARIQARASSFEHISQQVDIE